jgi:hypothetical protein
MSSRFYDERGFMLGLDKHLFMQGPLPPYIGFPVPETLHFVGQSNWLLNNGKVTPTVTSDTWHMCQKEYSLGWIPHVPLKLPSNWAPAELVVLAAHIAFSESKPRLRVHSVKGDGEALCATVFSIIGFNKNCDGQGIAFQWNSVQTQPSVGDYVRGVEVIADDIVIDKIFEEVLPNAVVRWLVKKAVDPLIEPVLEWLRDKEQELIDDVL